MDNVQCNITIPLSEYEYVGYGKFLGNLIMILISVLGILINGVFSFNYLKKMIKTKTTGKKEISLVETILCIVASIETIISICWLINNSLLRHTERMFDHCTLCTIVAHAEIFFYLFDWMILSTSLYQIRVILLDPEKTLEAGKFVIKYLIVSLAAALCSLIFSIPAKMGGISPLLTCFLNVQNFKETYQNIFFWIFVLLPLFCFVFGFSQVYLIIKSKEYKEKDNKKFFIEYSYFVIIYIIFSIFLIITYIVNFILIKNDVSPQDHAAYKICIFIVTFISCSTPLIVGLFRYLKTGLYKRLFNTNNIPDIENPLIDNDNGSSNNLGDLEKRLLQQKIVKYFTAISYVLGKSKQSKKQEEQEGNALNKSFNAMEHEDYKITKNEILKDFDLKINDDINVLNEANIDIEITEYNPSIFRQLRDLEGFSEDELISIFLPQKGTYELIQKKNQTIYINSTDKLLMLKEIKREKLLFYQRNFLPNIYEHIVNNPNSILCRVFGLYKIKIDQKEDVYMALMYNTNESVDSFTNSKNDAKEMKLKESELNNYIVEGKKKEALTNNKFKIQLNHDENIKLKGIIEKDIHFLKEKNIEEYKFLIFERNIEEKERLTLMNNDDKNENKNKVDPKSKVLNSKIKKYTFISNLPNIIYTICILGFSRKKPH